jgi:prepilin-type N-terminal cleavage/methylation domain-containing protein
MLCRFVRSTRSDQGFTLIELLVVILIIGVLAAIAIPSFLNQKSKAYDASAKEMARTAETAAEAYSTDHNGQYTGLTLQILHEYEGSIPASEAAAKGGAWLEEVNKATSNEFEVTAVAPNTKDKFSLVRNKSGEITRECHVGVTGAKTCPGASESSSW